MKMRYSLLTLAGGAAAAAVAAPEPTLVARDMTSLNASLKQLNSSLSALSKGPTSAFAAGYTSLLKNIKPSPTPANVAAFAQTMAFVAPQYQGDPLAAAAAIYQSGMAGDSLQSIIGNPGDDISDFGACNGYNNTANPPSPRPIYPKAGASDAPYDISEKDLRSAIYFPPEFSGGKTKPVLFVPGTGEEACENFRPNLGKLLAGTDYADPVYLNGPGNQLNDEQANAEFFAYAVNYVSALTGGKNVTIVTWSAGGPIAQWALKYWPSTRKLIDDLIVVSADFHGTVEVPLICPPGTPCAPSVLQQQFLNSNWINTLRANGGDSSYVPTTTIHSIFDEIVEPQQNPFASANINNARGAGATNVQLQDICPVGTVAGGPHFGHEYSLYSPVTAALVKDAITHAGPANVQRAGPYNCSQYMASGLSYSDVIATEAIILLAGYNIETYPNKTTTEPPIKAYAAGGNGGFPF